MQEVGTLVVEVEEATVEGEEDTVEVDTVRFFRVSFLGHEYDTNLQGGGGGATGGGDYASYGQGGYGGQQSELVQFHTLRAY